MKKLVTVAIILVAVCISTRYVIADQAEDCVDLVKKAVTMFKEQGKEKALKAINDKNGPFIKGDLYVFAFTMDNVMLANPYEQGLDVSKPVANLDTNGVPLFRKFMEVVEKDDSAWIDYKYAKPGAEGLSQKRSFVKKVPADDIYVGCGYYVDTAPQTKSFSKK